MHTHCPSLWLPVPALREGEMKNDASDWPTIWLTHWFTYQGSIFLNAAKQFQTVTRNNQRVAFHTVQGGINIPSFMQCWTYQILKKNSNEPTYMYIRIHRVTQVQSWRTHTYTNTHTLHPTCSVNRDQDVADIWVREQTRDAPRKRWIEEERERGREREREREGGRSDSETKRTETERARETDRRGREREREGVERQRGRRQRERDRDRQWKGERGVGGQMKWWLRNEIWKEKNQHLELFSSSHSFLLSPRLSVDRRGGMRRTWISLWTLPFLCFSPHPSALSLLSLSLSLSLTLSLYSCPSSFFSFLSSRSFSLSPCAGECPEVSHS